MGPTSTVPAGILRIGLYERLPSNPVVMRQIRNGAESATGDAQLLRSYRREKQTVKCSSDSGSP